MPTKANQSGQQPYDPKTGEYLSVGVGTKPYADKIKQTKGGVQTSRDGGRLGKTKDKIEFIAKNSATTIDFKGIASEQQDEVISSIYEHYEDFPELRDKITFVGGSKEFIKQHAETIALKSLKNYYDKIGIDVKMEELHASILEGEIKKAKKYLTTVASGDNVATAIRTPDKSISAIVINEKLINHERHNEERIGNVKIGFHPQGTESFKATIDHELAHKLDDIYGISKNDTVMRLYEEAKAEAYSTPDNQLRIKFVQAQKLSRYAFTNIGEFVAEAWSEYRNNPNPRPIATAVGREIENARKQKTTV